jgi:excisionase family DNA binding protein
MTTRKGAEEQEQQFSQLQWLLETLRKFGTPTLALTKDEAARELRIKRTKLDRLIELGFIRQVHYEQGDHPKIPRSEIERFLSEKLDEASPAAHGSRQAVTRAPRTQSAGVVDVEADIALARALRKKQRPRR